MLKKLERQGKRETAPRTRSFASRVFRHGVAMAMCKSDPAALLSDALSSPIIKHHAAILEPKKLGELLRAIEDYPALRVELLMADRRVDLIEEGVDLAIRLGPLEDSSFVSRRLTSAPRYLVASPAMSRGGVRRRRLPNSIRMRLSRISRPGRHSGH